MRTVVVVCGHWQLLVSSQPLTKKRSAPLGSTAAPVHGTDHDNDYDKVDHGGPRWACCPAEALTTTMARCGQGVGGHGRQCGRAHAPSAGASMTMPACTYQQPRSSDSLITSFPSLPSGHDDIVHATTVKSLVNLIPRSQCHAVACVCVEVSRRRTGLSWCSPSCCRRSPSRRATEPPMDCPATKYGTACTPAHF